MDIKEQIHVLSEEMIENLGKLVAVDSQLGTPAEGKPFGEGPADISIIGILSCLFFFLGSGILLSGNFLHQFLPGNILIFRLRLLLFFLSIILPHILFHPFSSNFFVQAERLSGNTEKIDQSACNLSKCKERDQYLKTGFDSHSAKQHRKYVEHFRQCNGQTA